MLRDEAAFNSEDDTFSVQGRDSKGIPPGKYKVAINIMTLDPTPAVHKLNEQYTEAKTPIEVEVTGPQLDIDLASFKSS